MYNRNAEWPDVFHELNLMFNYFSFFFICCCCFFDYLRIQKVWSVKSLKWYKKSKLTYFNYIRLLKKCTYLQIVSDLRWFCFNFHTSFHIFFPHTTIASQPLNKTIFFEISMICNFVNSLTVVTNWS